MLGAGVEVAVRRGRLILRTLSPIPALFRGLQLHPDDRGRPVRLPDRPLPVRPGHGQGRVQPRPSGVTTGIHLDGVLLSAEKRHPGLGSA